MARKTRKPRPTKDDIYRDLADTMIDAIQAVIDGKADTLPWRKPWLASGPTGAFDYNPHTRNVYKGINTLVLWVKRATEGYTDSRWGTYNNWKKVGGQVRRGEKATRVVFWKIIEKDAKDASGNVVRGADGKVKQDKIPFIQTTAVFNRDQVDGLEGEKWNPVATDEPTLVDPTADETSPLAEAVIDASKCPIHYKGAKAFYSPGTDSITLPPRATFETAAGFYGVALHEQIHSTLGRIDEVHTSENRRKNREKGGQHGFGTQAYAFEELVAEFGAAFLSAATGVRQPTEIGDNHVAYLRNWVKTLKDDPAKLYQASVLSSDASNYLLDAAGIDPVAAILGTTEGTETKTA